MQHDLTRFYPLYDQRKSFRPVDMLLPGRTDPNIYSLSINGEWNQLIACNFTDKPTTISVPLSGNQADTGALGLQPNKHYYLYDFWNDRFIGKIPGKQSAKLPVQADQALSYSVHQVKDHPQFISTNRHIMQGLMDLKDVKWDPKTGIYSRHRQSHRRRRLHHHHRKQQLRHHCNHSLHRDFQHRHRPTRPHSLHPELRKKRRSQLDHQV